MHIYILFLLPTTTLHFKLLNSFEFAQPAVTKNRFNDKGKNRRRCSKFPLIKCTLIISSSAVFPRPYSPLEGLVDRFGVNKISILPVGSDGTPSLLWHFVWLPAPLDGSASGPCSPVGQLASSPANFCRIVRVAQKNRPHSLPVQFLWAFCFRDLCSCLSLCRQRLQLDLLAEFIKQSRWFYDLSGVGEEVAFYVCACIRL